MGTLEGALIQRVGTQPIVAKKAQGTPKSMVTSGYLACFSRVFIFCLLGAGQGWGEGVDSWLGLAGGSPATVHHWRDPL